MIVIPMMGRSERFTKAGYREPKYRLTLFGHSVFALAVRSFASRFNSEPFVFVVREGGGAADFVRAEARRLGIVDVTVVELEGETRGQAESVYRGIVACGLRGPLYIFNIDTFRFAFDGVEREHPTAVGVLDVFRAEGSGWSFVDPGHGAQVLRTTEKERVSDLCSTGLYWFSDDRLFVAAFEEARARDERVRGEYYVAPLYNSLIARGLSVEYAVAAEGDVVCCGTPDEYSALAADPVFARRVATL